MYSNKGFLKNASAVAQVGLHTLIANGRSIILTTALFHGDGIHGGSKMTSTYP